MVEQLHTYYYMLQLPFEDSYFSFTTCETDEPWSLSIIYSYSSCFKMQIKYTHR
jgi:hypothetical protein